MTIDQLKGQSKEEVFQFIRDRLSFKDITRNLRYVDKEEFKKEHKRFEMSTCEGIPCDCTIWNAGIINEFADLGIYNYTSYLFLDFYKDSPTLYLKYIDEEEDIEIHGLDGYGTTELIYKIFELTIFSGKGQREESEADRFDEKYEGSTRLYKKAIGFHPY